MSGRAGTAGSARQAGAPRGWQRALRLARRGYTAALLVLLVVVAVRQSAELRRLLSDVRPGVLLLCLVMTGGQLLLTSAIWSSGLRALGSPVPWRASLAATAASAPARYLPGGIWFAVSRGAELRRRGVPLAALGAVAALETALVPVTGFALGGLLLLASGRAGGGALTLPLAVAALALLVLASPPVVNAVLRLRHPAGSAHRPPRLGWGAHGRLVGWIVLFWAWSAATFASYVSAFPAATDAPAVAVAGAFMVAWGVGWLAVFAPQGVGVFEVTLAALLASGAPAFAGVVAGYRAVVLVRDVVVAGAVAAGRARAGRR